jgi:hypothetical protein
MAESINKLIVAALAPFGLPVAENLYRGKKDTYFVYYIADDAVADAGDDTAQAYVAFMQIHYISPMDEKYTDIRRRIRKALVDAGFTPPSITDVSDLTSQVESERVRHLVFETSIENEYDMEV